MIASSKQVGEGSDHPSIPCARRAHELHKQAKWADPSPWQSADRLDNSRCFNYIVIMESLRIEWDNRKNSANIKKHGISFEEARTVFVDERALLIHDPDHSDDEDRFILLGMSARLRILLVCHCYRAQNEIIRIISARRAGRKEQEEYSERKHP